MLGIYAKILPRVVLMSTHKNLVGDSLNICLAHKFVDTRQANKFAQTLHENYPNGIGSRTIEIEQINIDKQESCSDTDILFVFHMPKADYEPLLNYAHNKRIIIATYDPLLLEEGFDLSLYVSRSVKVYINPEALSRKQISLDPALLKASQIYINKGTTGAE